MNIIATELGADSMVLRVAGHDGDAYDTWYRALTEAVGGLVDSDVLDVAVPLTGDFVTTGVSCLFKGKDFVVWSDVPGEILVKFGTLRPSRALELIDALKNVWAADAP